MSFVERIFWVGAALPLPLSFVLPRPCKSTACHMFCWPLIVTTSARRMQRWARLCMD